MPEQIIRRILRLDGYEIFVHIFDEEALRLTMWVRQNPKDPFHTCGGCGVGVRQLHSFRERWVRDLPWGEWKVWLVIEMHRVVCSRCGVKTERIDFLEGKHPYTKRFAAAVARECQDAPVNRVAARWGLSQQTVRRIDKRSLEQWSQQRSRKPLRWMGVDEIFWRKGRCLTVVSDLELGEPIWAGPDRSRLGFETYGYKNKAVTTYRTRPTIPDRIERSHATP